MRCLKPYKSYGNHTNVLFYNPYITKDLKQLKCWHLLFSQLITVQIQTQFKSQKNSHIKSLFIKYALISICEL